MKYVVASWARFPVKLICYIDFGSASDACCLLKSFPIILSSINFNSVAKLLCLLSTSCYDKYSSCISLKKTIGNRYLPKI